MLIIKPYYYLLFRIYCFYIDKMKEEDIPLFYVTSISSLLIFLNLYTINILVVIFSSYSFINNSYIAIIFLISIWILNYFTFVRFKKFLEFNFRKDKKGEVLVLIYIILSAVVFILAANAHRALI